LYYYLPKPSMFVPTSGGVIADTQVIVTSSPRATIKLYGAITAIHWSALLKSGTGPHAATNLPVTYNTIQICIPYLFK
jgi:hypothetical protein